MSSEPFNERRRLIRFRMKREQVRIADEIRLVPKALYLVVAALYVIAVTAGLIMNRAGILNDGQAWPPGASHHEAVMAVIGVVTAAAIPIALVILLIGYVNQDAKRRGMNSGLCTLMVIIMLPAWVLTGFIIYFVIRDPLPYHCTQCGTMVSARYAFCPKCRYNLRPTCPQCNHEVSDRDIYCPYCGRDLAGANVHGITSEASQGQAETPVP